MEDAMRKKVGPVDPATSNSGNNLRRRSQITDTFTPTSLEIFNDSHLHAHHKAMQGSTSRETHFRFGSKIQLPVSEMPSWTD